MQFFVGYKFYLGSYHSIRAGNANMDVLVAVGTTISYVYSVAVVVMRIVLPDSGYDHEHVSFEMSTMLLLAIVFGKWLESLSMSRTSKALEGLMRLQPDRACLLKESLHGQKSWEDVDTRLLEVKDRVKVIRGARIPVDGTVIEGKSNVDESLLTGESIPVLKEENDTVIGGTTNCESTLIIEATNVGESTVLSKNISLIEMAQTSKAPVQRFAD